MQDYVRKMNFEPLLLFAVQMSKAQGASKAPVARMSETQVME